MTAMRTVLLSLCIAGLLCACTAAPASHAPVRLFDPSSRNPQPGPETINRFVAQSWLGAPNGGSQFYPRP